jgi:hypothetical protein
MSQENKPVIQTLHFIWRAPEFAMQETEQAGELYLTMRAEHIRTTAFKRTSEESANHA